MKYFLILALTVLFSCSNEKCNFIENRNLTEINGEKFINFDFTIDCQDTTIQYIDNLLVPYNLTIPDKCKDSVNYILWESQFNEDFNKLIILIPGIQTNYKLFYPIAFDLLKKGYNVAFTDIRGKKSGFNSELPRNDSCNEILDIERFINFYESNFLQSKNLDLGIFGVSLGGIIGLNVANSNNTDVKFIVTEGLPYDLKKSYDRLKQYEKLFVDFKEEYGVFSLSKIDLNNLNNTQILSIWSSGDKIVTGNDQKMITDLLERKSKHFEYIIYPKDYHTFRAKFKEKIYSDVNNKIIKFIDGTF